MSEMFCFQCQEAAAGKGCTKMGVCGKQPETSNLQDELVVSLINLAKSVNANKSTEISDILVVDGLFLTLTNVNFDNSYLSDFIVKIKEEINKIGYVDFKPFSLWEGDEDTVSLRSTLLFGMKGMAAYAHNAHNLGYEDKEVTSWFYKGLSELSQPHTVEGWLEIIMEFGKVNFKAMELLDKANNERFGAPTPTKVTCDIKKGPFIVVSGHDLNDLEMLLKQTQNKGINIYTHGEMLPAHGYPALKAYPHLAGNFGTAWQNQRKEFDNIPAPILFSTNCLTPQKESYKDRVFTTAVVGFEGLIHIESDKNGHKDFTPVIEKALELGGYEQDRSMSGINGGHTLTTGFGHNLILSQADTVINAVKQGIISHFFLVGGCDGIHSKRSYYTDFVKQTPDDSIILTLACGKFRFNDLDLGEVAGLPRIMDMGQCNDAYGAVKVAIALSQAFECDVNDLPLTLVLSWYEQKAVCILLSLLSLGVKNIYLGPTLPAFMSENVVNFLVENYGLHPITTPEQNLNEILKKEVMV